MDRDAYINCRMIRALTLILCALTACNAPPQTHVDLPKKDQQSGYKFLTAETQALQDDDFANPGFLWVDKGETLFNAGEKACVTCHTDNLKGASTTFPKVTAQGGLINLEGQINLCRVNQQLEAPLPYESDDLLSLTAYIAHQSRGMPNKVKTDGPAANFIQQGRDYFFTRRGQMNLACSTCHDKNWGKKLRGDTISQGHSNAFPAYRLEWQSLGSLHRRLHDCDTGVRAEPQSFGSDTYTAVELYLAARASDQITVEVPGVRR